MNNFFTLSELNTYWMDLEIKTTCSIKEILDAFHISKSNQYKLCQSQQLQKQYQPHEHCIIYFTCDQSKPSMNKEIEIIYEDDTLLVANKPPFLLVHDDGHQIDTLQSRINAYLYQKGESYAQALHRIDTQTSGLVFFSKNKFFQPLLETIIQDDTHTKEYLCVVDGDIPFQTKEIHQPIARNRHTNGMIVHPKGKEAHTYIETLEVRNNRSLLRVRIRTGRKHQIRVHLASIGYPILNDPIYGTIQDQRGLLLQHNHFVFKHPITKQTIDLQLPQDPRLYL